MSRHEAFSPLDRGPVWEALARAGAPVFWAQRCAEAVVALCVSPQGSHAASNYARPRVTSSHFPLRGAFTFTRQSDGVRFRLTLRGRKWKAVQAA